VLLLLPARALLALLAQALVAAGFLLAGHTQPWEQAAGWFPVWGSAVDVGCLAAMALFARGEGRRLRDLLPPLRVRADGWAALGATLQVLVVGGVGGTAIGFALYGGAPPIPMGRLPAWGTLYGVLVWPLLWGITEQLTYNGFLLPRLEALLPGRRWLAPALVVAAWTLQHVAMPLRLDATFTLYRALSPLPVVLLMVWLHVRHRRLAPLMAAHVVADALSVLLAQAR
jgi:hypothetical protein